MTYHLLFTYNHNIKLCFESIISYGKFIYLTCYAFVIFENKINEKHLFKLGTLTITANNSTTAFETILVVPKGEKTVQHTPKKTFDR